MRERSRKRIFAVAGTAFFGLFAYASLDLPAWGSYRGPYGDFISNLGVYERHATDVVNAINYDYRGFDTLGEEFILFTAVVGVMMLLRREEGAPTKPIGQQGKMQDQPGLGVAVRITTLPAVVLTIIFGFYIGLHGALTPGGGFQAGVILASSLLLVYLAENTEAFKRLTSHKAVELVEAIGAGAYALIGLAPLCLALPLVTNWLPLGTTGDVFASGNIALISATVGVEVTAAFLLVLYTYLEEIITGEVPAE
ncbi:MAG: hydrogen gas-evolving membrane-bound hydrogenase subunit E [Janthinobacterium lividum]